MAVVCSTCNTQNRDSAMFCRGCTGKLPAFAATGTSALGALQAGAAARRSSPPRAGTVRRDGGGAFWLGLGLSVGAMMLAFFGWYLYVTRDAARPVAPVAVVAPATTPTQSLPLTLLTPVEPVQPVQAIEPVATVDALPARSVALPVRAAAAPQPQSPVVVAAAEPTARTPTRASSGARQRAADPRAMCGHLNFVAAARCEAAQCDSPAYSRHPRCDAVREQRRLDVARRNPLMAN